MKPVVGVIGLGAMGQGMALSLRRNGFPLRVFDLRPGVAEAFARDGGTACASAAELAAGLRGGGVGGRQRGADRRRALRQRQRGRLDVRRAACS